MSEKPSSPTLNAFLSDLVQIRERSGVSLDDIRVKTKVYPHVIAQFESDGLHGHPLFNNLYLKAFVRSYAIVIGVSPEFVVDAYEGALNGRYERELAVKYLGHELVELQDVTLPIQPNNAVEVIDEPSLISSNSIPASESLSEPNEPRVKKEYVRLSSKKPTDDFAQFWRRLLDAGKEHGVVQWGILAGCIVIGVLLITRLITLQNTDVQPDLSQATTIQETSVADENSESDSLTEDVAESATVASSVQSVPATPVTLGDSLHITVIAKEGKLDPFRARLDGDLRRPYWLNAGDSMQFWMNDQIIIEDNLQFMEVLLEERPFPIYQTDSTARVVINRDTAMVFFNSIYQ